VIASDEQLAWALRKNNPQLKQHEAVQFIEQSPEVGSREKKKRAQNAGASPS